MSLECCHAEILPGARIRIFIPLLWLLVIGQPPVTHIRCPIPRVSVFTALPSSTQSVISINSVLYHDPSFVFPFSYYSGFPARLRLYRPQCPIGYR